VTLAQDVLQAKLVKESSPDPRYPEEARKKGLQGVVKLHVLVAKDGSVKKLSVISGDPILAKSFSFANSNNSVMSRSPTS